MLLLIVNHVGLLYKLQAPGVGGSILRVVHDFLTDRIQKAKIVGVCSSTVDVVSGIQQGSVLKALCCSCFIPVTFLIF